MRFVRNPADPAWGAVHIEIGGKLRDSTINPDITSLVMGDTPSRTTSVGDSPTIRGSAASITLFASGSTSNPKVAICLWLDGLSTSDGG